MDPKFSEPALVLHLAGAAFALIVGGIMVLRRKGDRPHRLVGRAYIVALATVAISAFWINDIRMWGPFSPLHLLSILTLSSIVSGIGVFWFVKERARAIATHRQVMLRLYGGAMLIPGAFTLLPNRLLGRTFFPGTETWPNYAVMALMIAAGAAVLVRAFRPLRDSPAATVRASGR